ncbi:hypothetical protein BHE74_00019403 [Ensete ventricosum]|nr:hypothetical protein BHE74_00019403 [Ensete ventricosum]
MHRVEFRSVFCAPSQNFKILAVSNVFAHGKSYEHDFTKKCDDQKLYAKVEFRLVFCAPSQNFKILAISNVFAHGKSYEHGFAKKRDGHKLSAKSRTESSFDWFFMHRLRISKY